MIDYKQIIVQWMEFEIPPAFPRYVDISLTADFIAAITGPRRGGKTYLCFLLMQRLIDAGVPRNSIVYVNFEDERLVGAQAGDMDALVDAYLETYSPDPANLIYMFLDEIQNVGDWDAWVRRTHDYHHEYVITITGSSSKLLSQEISTKLRGRTLNWEVLPLSFKEYLAWKGVDYNLRTLTKSAKRNTIKKDFGEFLRHGGYPAVALHPELTDIVLQGYYDSMIFKDVVERYNIKEVKKLRLVASMLFESVAREMSYNRIAHKLQSAGHSISKNTIIEYISHFEDACLFFQHLKFEYTIGRQLGAVKKVYCIDNGLLTAMSFQFMDTTPRLLENCIFLELRRRGLASFYFKGRRECDFIIQEKNRVTAAIQVTWELSADNEDREIGGLLEAMNNHQLPEGWIITSGQTEDRNFGEKIIHVVPAWLWLLE